MSKADALAPVIGLEVAVVGGRTYQAYKRGKTDEARERFIEETNDTYSTYKYLLNFVQGLENVKELKYTMAYFDELLGFVKPEEYAFNEEEQFIFEAIFHTAMTLYRSGGASKTKLVEQHNKFVAERLCEQI